jgi:hypothetical protein
MYLCIIDRVGNLWTSPGLGLIAGLVAGSIQNVGSEKMPPLWLSAPSYSTVVCATYSISEILNLFNVFYLPFNICLSSP